MLEMTSADVCRRPFFEQVTQRVELARFNEALDFGYEDLADHVAFLALALAQSNDLAKASSKRYKDAPPRG